MRNLDYTKDSVKWDKTIVIPVGYDMWRALKDLSYHLDISMNEIARHGINKIIPTYEKRVDSKRKE